MALGNLTSFGFGAGGFFSPPPPRTVTSETQSSEPGSPGNPLSLPVQPFNPANKPAPKFPSVDLSRKAADQSGAEPLPSTGIDTSKFQKSTGSQRPYIWKYK
jgi:hypothetical protein